MSAEQTKQELATELLSNYKAKDDEVNRIKNSLDEANKNRSEAVKAMYDKLGKGPFTYKGEYLGKIVVRGQTYFLRGKSDDNSINID